MDQLLAGVADDWRSTQDIGERLAKAKQKGASWRFIAYRTGIPTTTVRRWAAPFLAHEPAPGGAATPGTGTGRVRPGAGTSGPPVGSGAAGPRATAHRRAAHPTDGAVAPRPGGHPVKNTRRVGFPNHC
jgi:hypothetical protein